MVKVKDIEAERISLPTVNIELKGKKPPIQAWKEKSISSEYRAHIKNNPNIFWKPLPSARSAKIDDSELTFRQYRIERAMNKNMSSLPKISGEEFVSLTNLLSKILRYEPESSASHLRISPSILGSQLRLSVNHNMYLDTGLQL